MFSTTTFLNDTLTEVSFATISKLYTWNITLLSRLDLSSNIRYEKQRKKK